MVLLARAFISFYRLLVVTVLLSAAVWLQFGMQAFEGGARSIRYIRSSVSK